MYGQKHRPIQIGLDYDDVITAAPEMFKEIIGIFKRYGCGVYITTSRATGNYDDMLREFEGIVDGVIFTDAKAKMMCAEIDIWIDDFPLCITHDFSGAIFKPCRKIVDEMWTKP